MPLSCDICVTVYRLFSKIQKHQDTKPCINTLPIQNIKYSRIDYGNFMAMLSHSTLEKIFNKLPLVITWNSFCCGIEEDK